ncbi:MAG: hypothetical protein ACK5R7_04130 [Armatimonadota bacterium]|jgi:hypothetical protein
MIRFQTLLVASSLLAVSVAQSPVVGFSEGRGVALNANGGQVAFQYNGVKLQDGTVRGGGTFTFTNAQNEERVSIHVREWREFAAQVPVAEMGGPVRMTIEGPQGLHVVEGKLAMRVADLRTRTSDPQDLRDQIRLVVTNPQNTVAFRYEGAVREGNLVVRSN